MAPADITIIIIIFILTNKNIHVKSNYIDMKACVNWIIRPRVISDPGKHEPNNIQVEV